MRSLKPFYWGIIFSMAFLAFWAKAGFAQNTSEAEIQWVLGEVIYVDANNNQMVIKYLDYESDLEKQMTINVDNETAYEGIKTLADIKPQDTASIDYIVQGENNIAKKVGLEKVENKTTEPLPSEETTPNPE